MEPPPTHTVQDKPLDVPKHGQERRHAHELLQQHAQWWEAAYASSTLHNPEQPLELVFYRIRIDKITGRRATPSPGGPVTLSKSRAGENHTWPGRVFHALFKPYRVMKKKSEGMGIIGSPPALSRTRSTCNSPATFLTIKVRQWPQGGGGVV